MTNLTQTIGLSKLIERKIPKGVRYSKKNMYEAIGINPKRFEIILKDASSITLKEAEAVAEYLGVDILEVVNLKNS